MNKIPTKYFEKKILIKEEVGNCNFYITNSKDPYKKKLVLLEKGTKSKELLNTDYHYESHTSNENYLVICSSFHGSDKERYDVFCLKSMKRIFFKKNIKNSSFELLGSNLHIAYMESEGVVRESKVIVADLISKKCKDIRAFRDVCIEIVRANNKFYYVKYVDTIHSEILNEKFEKIVSKGWHDILCYDNKMFCLRFTTMMPKGVILKINSTSKVVYRGKKRIVDFCIKEDNLLTIERDKNYDNFLISNKSIKKLGKGQFCFENDKVCEKSLYSKNSSFQVIRGVPCVIHSKRKKYSKIIVSFYGGFFNASLMSKNPLFSFLIDKGYTIVEVLSKKDGFISYSDYVNSSTSETYKEVSTVTKFFKDDNSSIIALSFSHGGLTLRQLTKNEEVDKVIAICPVFDIRNYESYSSGFLFKCDYHLNKKEILQIEEKGDREVFIVHGNHDLRVPVEHSKLFAKEHQGDLTIIKKAGHNIMDKEDFQNKILELLK